MKKIFLIILVKILTFISLNAHAEVLKTPAKLQHNLDFIFQKVLELKHLSQRSDIPMPAFYFESKTPLKQFQDAIEKQWGMRPDQFTNAFAVANNEIYIMDDSAYYERNQRCMDDSIAHELTHYLQVKYQNWDLMDESLEWDAVDIQTQFRNLYCRFGDLNSLTNLNTPQCSSHTINL